ncbi:hypothetical protein G6F59_014677 [Rhizopus arrhizus]|nr:hypothetical protein G6F59_014677 [Rhizopus arrhizus]
MGRYGIKRHPLVPAFSAEAVHSRIARRLMQMAENAANVIGIELLAAAQGCDFHAPLRSSAALESVRATLRAQVPTLEEDRYFHPDMVTATNLVRSGALAQGLSDLLPTVEPQA